MRKKMCSIMRKKVKNLPKASKSASYPTKTEVYAFAGRLVDDFLLPK